MKIAFSSGPSGIDWKASNNTGMPESLVTDLVNVGTRLIPYFFADEQLVFGADLGNDEDILMTTVDNGAKPVPLVHGAYSELNAALSPDGRWIAYDSNESGTREIYVRPFPDVDRDVITVSNDGGVWPVWSPQGGELFYVEPVEKPRRQLISVSITDSDTGFSIGQRTALFEWAGRVSGTIRPYDVFPDGQRFLALNSDQAADTAQIIIVENWTEELKRLMPTD